MPDIDRTAIMTSDIAPSPNAVTARGELSGYEAFHAFDKTNNQWADTTNMGSWIKYDFGSGIQWPCSGYAVTADPNDGTWTPSSWTFQGSNDNSTWTTLDTQSGQTFTVFQRRRYAISNTASYRYFQWINLSVSHLYVEFTELTIESPIIKMINTYLQAVNRSSTY